MTTIQIILGLLGIVGIGGIITAIMTKQKELANNFLIAVLAMRKDLWSKKADLDINEIMISEKTA